MGAAILAMIFCSGGAGAPIAIAGPVNLRLSNDFTAAAAVGVIDTPVVWLTKPDESEETWFPDTAGPQPSAPPPPTIQSPARPGAIMISLPAPICLEIAGLTCAFVMASVFNRRGLRDVVHERR
jgi:hypothetical protein